MFNLEPEKILHFFAIIMLYLTKCKETKKMFSSFSSESEKNGAHEKDTR